MNFTLHKLEYNQIQKQLETYCKTYLGKLLCQKLTPSFTFEEVQQALFLTSEANSLLFQKGLPPLAELNPIEQYIKPLESSQTLSSKALFDLAKFLKLSYELRKFFYGDEQFNISNFPLLDHYFSAIYANPSIEKNIFEKILDENTIADNASSKLASLRKNRKNLEQGIKEKLNSFIYSSSYSKYIMDPIVTIRNNRYVIPVKEEYKDQIKGFIHDTSSSGSTLYIEPTSVFEMNNQVNHIKMEEELEIEKILQILSSSLFHCTAELTKNLEIIAQIDLLFAKVNYGKNINGVIPNLNQEKWVSFVKARHPLIDSTQVVPIDIAIGKDYTCLLITGPNTGGKTVALKTVGLLLLMAYSGIPIPCDERSSICVFSHIFVDIGDEQSIQESLSTFSSHITHIVDITNQATSNSLVLLDELGSGTDPLEGAALAISILTFLQEKGAFVCCTTHYQELKEFALVTDGFENASFEFDLEHLKPTYHLLLGIPGKSNAFAISQKLGLNRQILENATSYLKQDNIQIEELLKNIYDDKLVIEQEKEEILKNEKQISALRKSLEQANTQFLEKKQSLLEDAKAQARDIVLEAKEEVNEVLQELAKETTHLKQANTLRNQLNDKLKKYQPTYASSAEEGSHKQDSENMLTPQQIHKNLEVWVSSLQMPGIVLSDHVSKTNEVLVQVGQAKINVKLTNLKKIDNPSKTNSHGSTSTKTASGKEKGLDHKPQESKSQFVSSQINVIGQTVEEAIYVIDKYLDDCVLAHLSPVYIIHGKGTGKLREGIHQYLKKNPQVKSYRLGTFGEGEMGVTVVELF